MNLLKQNTEPEPNMATYEEKMETLKQDKIEELKSDIEALKNMKEGDSLPGSSRDFVARRLPRYLRTAAGNLRVAEAADPRFFTGYENLHIILSDDFSE